VPYDLENPACAIVLVGTFNPAIFSPAWFAKTEIITQREFDEATTQIIHSEVAQFDVVRFRVDIQQTRFQINTSIAPFVTIMDDVRRIFGEKLPHTPVSAFGINFHGHFKVDTPEQRIALGRRLAPTAPWGSFGNRLEDSAAAPDAASGLISLVMQETRPQGRTSGARRVEIQPSRKVDGLRGVFIAVNDHFDVEGTRPEDGATKAMDLLAAEFDKSEQEYRRIVSEMMDFAASLK
jgi:hypothetical protein